MFDFIPIDEARFKEYESWFADAELRRRVEPPTSQWVHHVRNEPGVRAWMVDEGGRAVGFVQLDIAPDRTGSFLIVVEPSLRRRGLGTRIVRALLTHPDVSQLRRLDGYVEHDNIAAQHCLRAAGFTQEGDGPDPEGFLAFVYRPSSSV